MSDWVLVALNAELDTGIAMNLMLGDCLERMKEIPDGSVDLILTDPPYGTTACKWDSVIDLPLMWEQLKRIIKPSGAVVLFGSQPFTSVLITSNLKMFKYEWVWHKNTTSGFAMAKKQPMRNHENILVFYSSQSTYNPIKELRDMSEDSLKRMNYDFTTEKGSNTLQNGIKKTKYTPEDKGLSYPKTVKKFNTLGNNSKERVHPTQKPVALMEYLIRTYTQEGETVLDFCMGSGTTGVACKNTGRKFIGIEKDAGYFEIAKQRLCV